MLHRLLTFSVALILLNACVHRELPEFDRQLEADMTVNLFGPIYKGAEGLITNFENQSYTPQVFGLKTDGSTIVVKKLDAEKMPSAILRTENRIVFFAVSQSTKQKLAPFYYNPRRLRLCRLESGKSTFEDDVIHNSDGSFSIIRGLGQIHELQDKAPLRLFRFNFKAIKGKISFKDAMPISEFGKHSYLPVISENQEVIHLHLDPVKKRYSIRIMNADGSNLRTIVGPQAAPVTNLRLFKDNRIVFASAYEGYQKLYEVKLEQPGMKPFQGGQPTPAKPEEIMLCSSFYQGNLAPLLLRIPQNFSLKQVIALTTARNPQVNYHRALLAAALIDANQAKLEGYPTLNFGAFYTPNVGIFLDNPATTSGDFLAESIGRGVLGLVQPLLDYKHNKAVVAERQIRARIAFDAVNNEINQKVAEAVQLYFEAIYYQRLIEISEEIIEVVGKRKTYYTQLRKQQSVLRLQILAAENAEIRNKSSLWFYQGRLKLTLNRLKLLCGLSKKAVFIPAQLELNLSQFKLPALARMEETALLNHPRMKAATKALRRAFYQKQTGAPIRPTMNLGASYGQSRRYFSKPVDDYITLSLSGSLPLASFKSAELHQQYWSEIMNSLQINRQSAVIDTRLLMEESYLDFETSQQDFVAKKMNAIYHLEALRSARIHHKLTALNEKDNQNPLLVNNALFEYLVAIKPLMKVKYDLALRLAKVYREAGIAHKIPTFYNTSSAIIPANALYLRESRAVISNDQKFQQFFQNCQKLKLKRVYLNLGKNSALIKNENSNQRTKLFIDACFRYGIEVFALADVTPWLKHNSKSEMIEFIKNIDQFNKQFNNFEPALAGIQLTTRSISGALAAVEEEQLPRYLELVSMARHKMGISLKLRADCPKSILGKNELMSKLVAEVAGLNFWLSSDQSQAGDIIPELLMHTQIDTETGLMLSQTAKDNLLIQIEKILVSGQKRDFFSGVSLDSYKDLKQKKR